MNNNNWQRIETNPTWDFNEEKELIGFYMGVEIEVGPNKSNLYDFKKSNGEIISVWGNTLLDTRFKNLEKGEEVKIVYLGKVKSEKTGREYHNFEVYHRKIKFSKVDDKVDNKINNKADDKVKDEDIPVIENENIDIKDIPF